MEKLGHEWIKSMTGTAPIRDEDSNLSVLLQDMQSREELASRTLKPLVDTEVRAGIASCIARGSKSLGFEIPDGVEGTMHYEQFRSWAKDQCLTVHVMHERDKPLRLLVLTPMDT